MSDLQEEQAALYTLGLLEPEEAASFEARLGSDPRLGGTVEMFREVQALALTLAARLGHYSPPAQMKRRILERVATVPQQRGCAIRGTSTACRAA